MLSALWVVHSPAGSDHFTADFINARPGRTNEV